MTTAITTRNGFAPQTLTEAMEFSKLLADSSMVPKQYQGRPQDILVCLQWGNELGLAPMQALQNIAVINGKPSVYGDAAMALVQHSPLCEDIQEYMEGEGTANPVAVCVAKRVGRKEVVSKFSIDDAKRANLWGKQGPWTNYPKRMMQMRARGFALRDAFPDVLKGLITIEEAQDYPTKEDEKVVVKSVNPLDKIALPVDNFVDNVVEVIKYVDVKPVDNLEEANKQAQVAAIEDKEESPVEQVVEPVKEELKEVVAQIPEPHLTLPAYVFNVPGRDPVECQTLDDFLAAYDEMCSKVELNGRMTSETKLQKLKSLHDANQMAFAKMGVSNMVPQIAKAGERRDRILKAA
jgi:hypothetical protein